MLHYGFELDHMGRKSEICGSEAAFRRNGLHLTGKVLCPPYWFILSWYKSPVLHSKSAIFLYCSQLWGRFEPGVLLDVDTIASVLPFLWLLLFQCLNWTISRSVRLWRSADRICILSLPCRMVRKQHLTYCQVGVSLPSLHTGVKSAFSVLQFKAVNKQEYGHSPEVLCHTPIPARLCLWAITLVFPFVSS